MASVDEFKTSKFSEGIRILQSQKRSKLEMAVTVETDILERKAFDQLGDDDQMDEMFGRNTDTPISEADHRRRWIYTRDFDKGYLLDIPDEIKMLNNPINSYTRNFVSMANRKKDDLIIDALDGPAISGKNGTATTVFDTAFSIATGGVGMTTDKIKQAQSLLIEAENDVDDPMNQLFLVMAQAQITELLNETEITSSDFNTNKVLVNGKLNQWYGFNIIQSQRLPLAAGVRSCFAWVKSSMKLGIDGRELTRVEQRADKRYSTQAYAMRHYGATRMDEKGVVRILCTEA